MNLFPGSGTKPGQGMSQRATHLLLSLLAFGFGIFLYALVAAQRPEPFTASVDGIGYFLPLIGAVSNHWLDGDPLRVLWNLGQGWVPWESGQVGYLYPGYLVPAFLSRLFDQPLLLLEYSAAFHLGMLGLMVWLFPPCSTSLRQRFLITLVITASSGSFLTGMNWHNYLAPAPWFAGLLGLVFRPLLDNTPLERKHRFLILAFSALFYTSSHPQMYVMAFMFIAIAVVSVEPTRKGLCHSTELALLQLPFLVPLVFLYVLAQNASPIWVATRDSASMLGSSLPIKEGLVSILLGQERPALLNPLAAVVTILALIKRRWWILAGQILLLCMMLPSLLPGPIGQALSNGLHGFRWPVKLAVYVLPLSMVLLLSLRPARLVWWCVAASIVLSVVNISLRHGSATSLESIHSMGVSGVIRDTRRCLTALGIDAGSRVAFVGRYKYNKRDNQISPAMQGIANNAVLLAELESLHLYEPLEPENVARAHEFLTIFWRGSLASESLSQSYLSELKRQGVDYLVASRSERLPATGRIENCGDSMYVLKISDDTPFPDAWQGEERVPLKVLPGGALESAVPVTTPPKTNAVRVSATPQRWARLSDGRWRWEPSLPGIWWISLTLLAWAITLVWCLKFPGAAGQGKQSA